MKKLFLLIVTTITILNASAQEVGSSQDQSTPVSIESLSLKLDKLQHDYDYLYCDYELHKLLMDLKDLSHSVGKSSNAVLINIYNSRYDRDLYNSYLSEYDSSCALFDALKQKMETVTIAVTAKIMSCDFNDRELNVLRASFNTIKSAVTSVEASLNYFDVALKAYRSKR